jgi:8-oxo-dGTP pyrophosphatase MutT (NUDIX family)
MEKPAWRVRSSSVVVDSPHLRLRKDELELPDGTVLAEYFVRESRGYVMIFPFTTDGRVVLVRQYRYGSDSVTLEFPAGTLDDGEAPEACARRELLEETGFSCSRLEALPELYAEPARSPAINYCFIAHDAQRTHEPRPGIGEVIETEILDLETLWAILRAGSLDSIACASIGYRALERLGYLTAGFDRSIGRNASSEPKG